MRRIEGIELRTEIENRLPVAGVRLRSDPLLQFSDPTIAERDGQLAGDVAVRGVGGLDPFQELGGFRPAAFSGGHVRLRFPASKLRGRRFWLPPSSRNAPFDGSEQVGGV